MSANNLYIADVGRVPLTVHAESIEFARVSADGTCTINWEVCEEVAKKWKPHGELYQAVAKLLIYAREQSRGSNS